MTLFFYGTLCDESLLRVVIGREVAADAAVLPDHAVHWAEGGSYPVLVPQAGSEARGVVLRGLSEADMVRLEWYTGGFGAGGRDTVVQVGHEQVPVRVFGSGAKPGAVWSLDDWRALYGAAAVATARDVMALRGRADPSEVKARYGQMLVRGAGRVRAAATAPMTRRFAAGPGDVVVAAERQPYARYFAVEEYDLTFRRFDGSHSPVVTRAVFISGDAVTVLPYDPVRDRVLLIEQFRAAPWGRGDPQPWCLEAIAGRIDPGETPEDCARREAVEESGLTIGRLLPVAQYYPSPGAYSEFLYSFVGLTDLPDGIDGVFGLEGEAEDIRGHLIGFDDLMTLVSTGEVANAPLILTALWLQRERAGLRAAG